MLHVSTVLHIRKEIWIEKWMQIPLSNKISNREEETMMIIFNMINLFALISYVLLQ